MMEPVCSVISILPYEIIDPKPGIYPGLFRIPAGTKDEPGILSVGSSVFYIPMAFGEKPLQAKASPWEVANSIVNDYVSALLGINESCRPGIWVDDYKVKDTRDVMRRCREREQDPDDNFQGFQKIVDAQNAWFHRLVLLADSEFKAHGNGNSISDLQKIAANCLNLKNKPWLNNIDQLALDNCPACWTPVNSKASICPQCRTVIKPEVYSRFESVDLAPSESKSDTLLVE